MMSWVWIGLWIVISIVVMVIVFVLGVAVGAFLITQSMYECMGIDYSFKEFLKDTFGHGKETIKHVSGEVAQAVE
jgi:hypothetical protein